MRIQNFRNLNLIYYEARPGLNVFLGNNAQGKTSFLEGIYLLSRPVSFRPAKDFDLLQYDCRNFLLEARCEKEEAYKLSVKFDREKSRKEIFLNEKKIHYRDAHLLKVVLFTPDDLYLVKGSPAGRRRYLDFILCQLDAQYEKSFSEYQALLKKRNLLIRGQQRKSPGFEAVNDLFIQTAAFLLWKRIQLAARLDQMVQEIFRQVYPSEIQLHLRYALSFPTEQGMAKQELLAEGLKKQLQAVGEREDLALKTLAGPHLDDLNIYLNGRIARSFASQGQQRSIAVTLKMVEVLIYERIKGDYPVFLLDEVLSELDRSRQQLLFDWLKEAPFQSFLTAVNLDGIHFEDDIRIARFENGQIL